MIKLSYKPFIWVVLAAGLFVQSTAFAAESEAQQRRGRADIYMQAATMLVKQSQGMLKAQPTRDTVKMVQALLTSAGQIFELAAFDYKQLVPVGGASQSDIESAMNGKKVCIESLQQINANMRAKR